MEGPAVNLNFFGWGRPTTEVQKKLDEILTTLLSLKMDIRTLTEKIDEVSAQLEKANAEIVAAKARDAQMRQDLLDEISRLQDSLADAEVPPETEASINRLTGIAQATDDIHPDEPPAEETGEATDQTGTEMPAETGEAETGAEAETGPETETGV